MVRTVKAKVVRPLKKGERAVLLPGPTSAEPWETWLLDGKGMAECVQVCARPEDNRLRKVSTLALPASQVYSLPLWLNETDSGQFAGMIHLQLELRGLQPRSNASVVFDYSVVAKEGTRTLVLVGALPASLPEEILSESYTAFDLSARHLPLTENTLTLWREQDRLVVALTRGKSLVYYQALVDEKITPRALQDINSILASLTMQDVLLPLRQVMVWADLNPAEISALQNTLKLPVYQAQRPDPVSPGSAWRLTPFAVGEAQKAREVWRWRYRGLLVGAGLYLLLVAVLLTRLFVTSYKVDNLRRWQAEHAQAIALVHQTRAAWKELESVVNEKNYPLEQLLHCTNSIPADQLHLTLFEVSDGHLLLKGEAKNAAAAYQFLDNLKRDPNFAGYTWEMPQPHLLPNDLAQLQIEGTHASTN